MLAPTGHVFVATGEHSLILVYVSPRRAGWRQLLEALRQGVALCAEADCDQCEQR